LKRKSTASDSVDNVLTVIRKFFDIDTRDYDIHLNIPGGIPIDGPSAGVTMVAAIYSAITETPIDHKVAMTGEVSIRGRVKPVGGVAAKIEAAKLAGCTRVLIPKENYQERYSEYSIEIIQVENIKEIVRHSIFIEKGQIVLPSEAAHCVAALGGKNREM
jgi:Lon-like ATP-dependent protease